MAVGKGIKLANVVIRTFGNPKKILDLSIGW